MLKTLENLQNGMSTSKSYEYAISKHRILNYGLSNDLTLEKFHTSPVNALDIDIVEDRFLLSGSKNGGIAIHDLKHEISEDIYQAKVVWDNPRDSSTSHMFCITSVQFLPTNRSSFVSSGIDGLLNVWDTARLQPDLQVELRRKIYCHHMSSLSTYGEVIAVGMQYPVVFLVDPREGGTCHELRGHEHPVPCVRWSPVDEHILASGGSDGRILLWDVRYAIPLNSFDKHNGKRGWNRYNTAHGQTVNGLRFTDDGNYLVSIGSDNRIRLWDVVLGRNTLVDYGVIINNNTSRQRAIDITCCTNPPVLFVPSSNYILMFDLWSGERIETLVGHFSLINYCLYRPTTQQLFTGASDRNIAVWSPDGRKVVRQKRREDVRGAAGSALYEDADDWSSDGEPCF